MAAVKIIKIIEPIFPIFMERKMKWKNFNWDYFDKNQEIYGLKEKSKYVKKLNDLLKIDVVDFLIK